MQYGRKYDVDEVNGSGRSEYAGQPALQTVSICALRGLVWSRATQPAKATVACLSSGRAKGRIFSSDGAEVAGMSGKG